VSAAAATATASRPAEWHRATTLSVVSPAPRDVWRELAAADPDVMPSQSPEWLDCVCAETGACDASRLFDFGDGRRLVLPAVRRGFGRLAREMSYPIAWGFGGLVGPEPRVDEVRAVMEHLRDSGAVQVRLRPNPLHDRVWAEACPAGTIAVRRRAHVIDLRDGFDSVWRGFTKNARGNVRRAQRSGLRVEVDEHGSLVPAFYEMYMRSVERWARQQHEPLVLARWRARRRDSQNKLVRILRGAGGKLWMAWLGDRPAAAILVLQGANAHDTRGVMDIDVTRPTRANHLLQMLAIEDACKAGCASYHLGESGSSRSLARYKESFGAKPHDYAEYLMEALPLSRADARVRSLGKRVIGFVDA
jgi:hypothetical protein